jgi:hypothetical protein
MISLNSNSFNYEINSYKFNKYENVLNYNYVHCKPLLNINILENDKNKETDLYYIFDCPGKDAFGHWVYESFIFIDYFLEINKIHPNIKILTSNKKKYIKNFFKLFNIKNKIVNKIDEDMNNVCFFSPVVSLNDENIDELLFKNLIDNLITKIHNVIKNDILYDNIIFLPRNKKDNSASNDRIIHGGEDIEENIINLGGTVLNTYEINNLKIQFGIINSFNTIILDYGSSFFVNCMFMSNKKIIVLDNYYLLNFQINIKSVKILYNYISDKNNIILVSGKGNHTINFCDIERFLLKSEN